MALPDPAPWIVDSAWNILNDPTNTNQICNRGSKNWVERQVTRGGQTNVTAFNYAVDLGPTALEWAKNNISKYSSLFGVYFTLPGHRYCGPHTDRNRDFVLIYLLQDGGDDHQTVFHQEHGHAVMRHRHVALGDYDLATPIYQTKLPLCRWILMNTNVIHSIENIHSGRYSLQISLDRMQDLQLESPIYHDG